MATINVLDADGAPQALEKPNANGRQVAASSRPVVMATEDLAVINGLGTALASLLSLAGLVGRQAEEGSRPVVLADEDSAVQTNQLTALQQLVALLSAPLQAAFSDFPGLTDFQLRASALSVVDGQARITWTQTVVTGSGGASTVLAANGSRKAIVFLPAGAANDWVYNFFGTAAAGASPIYPPAGGPFVLIGRGCPTSALSLLGTSGQKLVIWEGN